MTNHWLNKSVGVMHNTNATYFKQRFLRSHEMQKAKQKKPL